MTTIPPDVRRTARQARNLREAADNLVKQADALDAVVAEDIARLLGMTAGKTMVRERKRTHLRRDGPRRGVFVGFYSAAGHRLDIDALIRAVEVGMFQPMIAVRAVRKDGNFSNAAPMVFSDFTVEAGNV